MSKISIDLSSIKSAGIYTIEIDESQRTETQVTALRLLVGFNGKGPFNRPVFLQNESQRQKLFGDIDTKLEKKGCFFNRNAKTMLENGPILALNLLKVDDSFDGPDQVNYAALSLDAGSKNPVVADPGNIYGEIDYLADTVDKEIYGTKTGDVIPFVGKAPYSALFDRSRFWLPSDTNLMNVAAIGLGTASSEGFEKSNFINFGNCGTDEISLLVYKPENLSGYEITAKEWFGGEDNIPYKWIRPSDYISDYFIRVVAVKGNWTNYSLLSSDSIWGKYFDAKGILKDKIFAFSQAEGVTFIGSWSGCIIPDFTDKQGNYLYIKDRVNAQTESTGLLMAINEDAMQVISYDLNGVDLETGNIAGHGSWVYDYDGNSEADSEAGESEIGANGFKIDMVGHSFQDGVRKPLVTKKLENLFESHIFDGSTGTIDSSVWYLGDPSVNLAEVSYKTTVKTPSFDKAGQKLHLYGVYDASTNRRIKSPFCYVAMTETDFGDENKTKSSAIKNLVAYNANGKAADASAKISAILGDKNKNDVLVKNDLSDNTLYVDASVLFGDYAAYDSSTHSIYFFKVLTGVDGSEVITDNSIDASALDTSVWADNKTVSMFAYNGTTYGYAPISKEMYVNMEEGAPSVYGVNFLSYNYISNNSEEVLCNVRNAFYFNGKSATNEDSEPINLEDTALFDGKAPVGADNLNQFIITDEYEASNITVGQYVQNITFRNLQGEATKYGLIPGITRIVKKVFVNLTADNKFTYNGNKYVFNTSYTAPIRTKSGRRGFYLFTAVDPVLIDNHHIITRQLPITDNVISKSLRFIPLKGLHLQSRHRPGFDANGRIGINAGIEKIYSVLKDDAIYKGLMDERMVDFIYMVDSMSYGIDNEMGGKKYLAQICADRGGVMALISAPSKHQFQMSSDPCFCATYDSENYVKPSFDYAFLQTGGNVDMYNTKLFSLPGAPVGNAGSAEEYAKYAGVFYPHLIYRDKGHDILVPPAADVSNTFVKKFQGGNPYAICANQDGIIVNDYIYGVECSVSQDDRDILEPLGINSIVSEGGDVLIYGNQTCYQTVKSDYNKLHVRDVLNLLERSVAAVEKPFNFKYNTPQNRAALITAVTPVFEAVKLSGAIEWYELVCDESNNTADVIENDMLILDISLIVSRGMEKIVNRITLKRRSDVNA